MRIHRLVGMLIVIAALAAPATALAEGGTFDQSVSLTASLSGAAEVPSGDPDGFGFARISINMQTWELCFRLSVAGVDTPTAAHIHAGVAGVAGPIVVPLAPPSDGFANGCVQVAAGTGYTIVGDPGSYYVNVHTSAYPPGAVRGQLEYLGKQRPVLPTGPLVETLAEGLTSPRGIALDAEGAVYAIDGGNGDVPDQDDCFTDPDDPEGGQSCIGHTGRIIRLAGGDQTDVATNLPPFIGDVVVSEDGDIYVVTNLGGDPALRDEFGELGVGFGDILLAQGDTPTIVADVAAYEGVANPDGGEIDTNPYGMIQTAGGFLVADAGANAVFAVDAVGVVSTYAVFPDTLVVPPPFLGLPDGELFPMQAVPTSLVVGPDGATYMGELTGFPFEIGGANVWRLEDLNGDGDALDEGEATVYAAGFTNILDIAFDSQGRLYVLEIAKDGLLAAEDPEHPSDFTGALIRVEPDGSHTEIMSDGLVAPTGLAIGPDDTLYVSNFGVMPGAGQILHITLLDD